MGNKVGTVSIRLDADSKNLMVELNKAVDAVRKYGKAVNRETNRIKYAFNKLRRAAQVFASAFIFVHTIKAIGNLAASIERAEEEVQLLQLRMNQFSNETDGFARAYQLSQRLGTSLDSTGQGLTRLAIATKKLGLEFSQLEKIQENIVILGRAGGTSAEEMRGALIQLSQGLASGRLQGEELRSVLENLPLVAMEIARELNIDIGQIRKFAAEGRISAGVVASALSEINLALDDLPDTFSMATARMTNAWTIFKAALGGKVAVSPIGQFVTETLEQAAERLGFLGHLTNDQLFDRIMDRKEKLVAANADLQAKMSIEPPKKLSVQQQADGYFAPVERSAGAARAAVGELVNEINMLQAEGLARGLIAPGMTDEDLAKLRAAQKAMADFIAKAESIGITGGLEGIQKVVDKFVELGKSDTQKIEDKRKALSDLMELIADSPEFAKYLDLLSQAMGKLGEDLDEAQIKEKFEDLQAQFRNLQFTVQDTLDDDFEIKARLALELDIDSYSEVTSLLEGLKSRTTGVAESNATVIASMVAIRDAAQAAGGAIAGVSIEQIDNLLEAMRLADSLSLDAGEGMERLAQSIKSAAMSSDEFSEKVIQLAYEMAANNVDGITKEMVDAWVANMKNGTDKMQEFAKQAARNIQDAFADFLFDPFEDGLKGMLKSFIDTIRRMLAELAAHSFLMALFKEGTVFGDALRGRAIGGSVSASKPYLVGEKGPELFVPGASGTIIPAHKLRGGGGMTVIQNNNIDARGATQDVVRMLPSILAQNNAQLTAQLRDNVRRTGGI